MTSLTKTQQALLQQAKARNGFYSVECGSGRGNKGGRVIFEGTPKQLLRAKNSLTGKYLRG